MNVLKASESYMLDASVTREDALAALKVLLKWIGEDNVEREGLKDTPERVLRSYEEHFSGYKQCPHKVLEVCFSQTSGYSDLILLKNIRFESHCEHHMAPIIGVAHVGYIPGNRVAGLSKLARVVEIFAKRLQIQERMTVEIAQAIFTHLEAKGAAVVIEAEHHCLTTRGAYSPEAKMRTECFLGCIKDEPSVTHHFLSSIKS